MRWDGAADHHVKWDLSHSERQISYVFSHTFIVCVCVCCACLCVCWLVYVGMCVYVWMYLCMYVYMAWVLYMLCLSVCQAVVNVGWIFDPGSKLEEGETKVSEGEE